MRPQIWRKQTRGRSPTGRRIWRSVAMTFDGKQAGEWRYSLSGCDDRRVEVSTAGVITDLTLAGDRFVAAFKDGSLEAYAIPGGQPLWREVGDRERLARPSEGERQQIWIGDGCVWAVERWRCSDPPSVGSYILGRDLATGALVTRVWFDADRRLHGIVEADGGIVVEFDQQVIFVDRGGETELAETLSPGRELFTNGSHVVGLDRSGRDAWVIGPGRKFMWWDFPSPATGVVLEDTQVRVDVAAGSFAFPLAALAETAALGAGDIVVMQRGSAPSMLEGALRMAGTVAELGLLREHTPEELRETVESMVGGYSPEFELWTLLHRLGIGDGAADGVLLIARDDFLVDEFNKVLAVEGFAFEDLAGGVRYSGEPAYVRIEPCDDEEAEPLRIDTDFGEEFVGLAWYADEELERRGSRRRIHVIGKPVDWRGEPRKNHEYPPNERDGFLVIEPAVAEALVAAGFELGPVREPGPPDRQLVRMEAHGARVECYRGHHDPGGGDRRDCCEIEFGVDLAGEGVTMGVFVGHGGQGTGGLWARLTRYALGLIAAGPAIAAPEPEVSGMAGNLDEGELLVRAWIDRSELPREPLARVNAIAERLGAVIDRIGERWYGTHGTAGATGALVCTDGRRAAVLIRGSARAYVGRDAQAQLLLRDHTLAAQDPKWPLELADVALSSFTARPDPGAAALPGTAEVELGDGDRLVVLVGKVLMRPEAAIVSLVSAPELREAARTIEAAGPELLLNKWAGLLVERGERG